MNLDDELRRLFADDRLDIAVRPGAAESVVAAGSRARRRRVALTAGGSALAVGIVVAGSIALGSVRNGSLPPGAPSGTSTISAPLENTTVVLTAPNGPQADPTTTSTPTSAGPTTLRPGEVVIGPDGFGKLRLGMTFAQALATGELGGQGAPTASQACLAYDLVDHPVRAGEFQVGISRDRGVEVIFAPTDARTGEGMAVGTSAADALSMYPDHRKQTYGFTAPVPGNPSAQYLVVVDGPSVKSFSITIPDQGCVT